VCDWISSKVRVAPAIRTGTSFAVASMTALAICVAM
jgi:hypothetical protein